MKTIMEDLKIYVFNAISLLVSFSNIEMGLKIILLVASIGYTIDKWYNIRKKNR
jgi:hypothetical protein